MMFKMEVIRKCGLAIVSVLRGFATRLCDTVISCDKRDSEIGQRFSNNLLKDV